MELLVVIAILGVLAYLAMGALSGMQQRGWQVGCISQLRQLGLATQMLANDNNGRFPWMKYPAWPGGDPSMKTLLKPYTGTNPANSSWVGPGLVCPAAARNKKQWIWSDRWWPHYRYNEWYATNTFPQFKYSDAVLFFDVAWPDWNPNSFAHFPGSKASVNFGYADGHVGSLTLTEFKRLWPGTESAADLFKNGWIQNPTP